MKKLFLGLILTITVLTASITMSPVYATNNAPSVLSADSQCQCVTYVVNKLFGGPRPGNWPDANSMDTDKYWGDEKVVGKGNLRYRSKNAGTDDVIIMRDYATVYVWNVKRKAWDKLSSNIGGGSGHIGFVVSANYYDKYDINGKNLSGWVIKVKSANWDNDYDYSNGSDWSLSGSWSTANKCNNVNESKVFVPNGPAVGFWKKK
jgi:hypothetical protein